MGNPLGTRLSTTPSDGILDNHAPGPTILALIRVLARQAARDFHSTALALKSGALPTHPENWLMVKPTSGYGTDPLHTVEETAKILKLCTKSVRRMIERGELPAHRIGRRIRIAPADLHAFLKLRRDWSPIMSSKFFLLPEL